MPVCLQGGAEFGSRCRGMDARVLHAAGPGRVVVTALAGARGREHDTANANGVRYYRSLGAPDVVAAPDAREDEQAAYDACRSARLLVLPGGSPARLLDALTTTRVGDAVREVLAAGGVVSGASAGAMVLCAWTVLPEGGALRVVEGLGIVPWAVVVPHWRPGSRWADTVREQVPAEAADGLAVLGLPEQSGLLVDGTGYEALGASSTHLAALAGGTSYDASPLSRGRWPR
jgi:cyanophycinase-like exopeptidase